jgi:hypothetical protein
VTTVKVDFNALARDGLVKASRRRADGPVQVGDRVLAVDPDEGMEFDADVVEVDDDSGRIYLRVIWEPAHAPSLLTKVVGGGWFFYGRAHEPLTHTAPGSVRPSGGDQLVGSVPANS